MDPIIGWMLAPVILLYLAVAFLLSFLYAIYRLASHRHLLTPGETLLCVLMMICLPILGSLAAVIYSYHLENQELLRMRWTDDIAAEEPPEELDLAELERRRKQKRAARR